MVKNVIGVVEHLLWLKIVTVHFWCLKLLLVVELSMCLTPKIFWGCPVYTLFRWSILLWVWTNFNMQLVVHWLRRLHTCIVYLEIIVFCLHSSHWIKNVCALLYLSIVYRRYRLSRMRGYKRAVSLFRALFYLTYLINFVLFRLTCAAFYSALHGYYFTVGWLQRKTCCQTHHSSLTVQELP